MSKIKPFCRTFPNAETHSEPCSIATTIERHKRMLTVEELAPMLTLSPKTLYARVKAGSMPATVIGTSVRFDPYETATWLRFPVSIKSELPCLVRRS